MDFATFWRIIACVVLAYAFGILLFKSLVIIAERVVGDE